MQKYDIFISYRRKGGWETAKHLYDLMTRDGYSVSFDIDTLREGLFDEELLRRIDECTDFIVLLDKHVFDRTIDGSCPKDKDWLRRELAYAIELDKNIIPIMLEGFYSFPENLPNDIKKVQRYNGPKYDNYYFDTFYERLLNQFVHSVSKIKSDDNNGVLKVYTDAECRIYIDNEDKGIARPRQIMRIPLCEGSYCLLFESTADKNIFIEEIGYNISAHTEPLYQVKLKKNVVKPDVATISSEPEMTPEDMFKEGEKYYNGDGVTKDYKMAVYWYQKAAENGNGNADAMNKLGICHNNGNGVSKDYRLAVYWYQKASEQGVYDAMYHLFHAYEKGIGVAKNQMIADKLYEAKEMAWAGDKTLAIKKVKEALRQIHPIISSYTKMTPREMFNEGERYYYGRGIAKNYTQAILWYQKAADNGNADAMNRLGICYNSGNGVFKDYSQAIYWYYKAAEKGHYDAIYHLFQIYKKGIGVIKNQMISDKLYEAKEMAWAGKTQRAIEMVKDALK